MARNGDLDGKIKSTDYFESALERNQSCRIDDIEPNPVVLKIGEALLDETVEVSMIPLFVKENEDYLVELLAGLGRYGCF